MGVPIHPTDFRVADPYPEVLPGDLFYGLPPALTAAVALLLLGALLIGWALGRGAARPPASGAAALWKAVDDACQAAMKAHSDALPDKAAVLRQTIEARLGRTLALCGGLDRPLAALERALEGRPEPRVPGGHGDHGQGDGHDHGDPSVGQAEAGQAERGKAGPASEAAVTIVNNGRVEIRSGAASPAPGTGHAPGHGPDHGPDHGPHRPAPPRDLTTAQRRDALRRAVSDLNDHWRRKSQRLDELEGAWRELSARAPERRPAWKFR